MRPPEGSRPPIKGASQHGQSHQPNLEPARGGSPDERPHRSHRWLMLACCVPMLVIVAVLLISGTAGIGAVIFAVACVGIMTAMMLAMPRGH